MKKKLIKNLDEYRKWAFDISSNVDRNRNVVDDALGLVIEYDCWDYNEKGEEIDEQGNVMPETTAENMGLEGWVKELTFPVVVVYCVESDQDRFGPVDIVLVEFVELKDFKE